MKKLRTVAGPWQIVWAVIWTAGCGSGQLPTYPAIGTVTFPDGTALDGGWVEFRPIDSQHRISARGQIQADGTFQLSTFVPGDGAIEGEHEAVVVPTLPQSKLDEVEDFRPAVASRFRRFETSGLKYTVTRDSSQNRYAIQVTRPR